MECMSPIDFPLSSCNVQYVLSIEKNAGNLSLIKGRNCVFSNMWPLMSQKHRPFILICNHQNTEK